MSTVSLCIIAGNEAHNITRCLETSSPVWDELCIVRAVGEAAPDDTLAIAERWCSEHGKSFHAGEYRNRIPDLQHVDDFAAARQQSFDLATCDWCIWLDCDDYLSPENAKRLKMASEQFPGDCLLCLYLIEARGGEIMRERLIRRGKGKWVGRIHENCAVTGDIRTCDQISVFHSDHGPKRESSAKRNAALLKLETQYSARHFFYLQNELRNAGDEEGALYCAKAAIALLAPDKLDERYCCCINLHELEPSKAKEHLLTAAGISPWRREAYAYLCQWELAHENLKAAIQWFKLMDTISIPKPCPVTHQGMWYSFGAQVLHMRLLRALGDEKEVVEAHEHYKHDPDYMRVLTECFGSDDPLTAPPK